MADVEILKTGLLYEADMLAQALEDEGVPYYRQIEDFAGLRFAWPAMAAQGPGVFFRILVPEGASEDAREVLAGLPIEPHNNPGMWSFNPRPRVQRVLTWLASIALAIYFFSFLWDIVSAVVGW